MSEQEKSLAEKPEQTEKIRKSGTGKRKRAAVILVPLIFIAIIVGCLLYVRAKTHIKTDDAFVDAHTYSISARVSGNVLRVLVNDNQFVKKGDLLLELDNRDYSTRVQNATAQLDMARNETSSNYAQVDAARAAVNSERARLEQAELDLMRGRALYKKEVIPKEQLDRLETARKVASAGLRESEGALRRALAVLGLTGTGGKDAQIIRKKAELAESRLNLSYTKIYAPADGYITRKSVEAGNNIQPGQALMGLVSLDDVWVTANYKENQLTHVRPGQKVEFTVDMYPGHTFEGKIDSIMAGTGAAFSLLPPENATGNYVKVVQRIPVKIVIDKASDPGHFLRVGMSVEPSILTGQKFFSALSELNPFR